MHPLLARLRGGDFRSIGHSDEVVQQVLSRPDLLKVLMSGIVSDDPLVRMRAADAAEKVTRKHPDWLGPFKSLLLKDIPAIDQQEVRWHAALLFTRLDLTTRERTRVISILISWLEDKSRIVQTFSLQALADFSKPDPRLRAEAKALVEAKMKSGPPSVRARCRKLLKELSE